MKTRRFYGIQFHPEVTHTAKGAELLSNFVHEICGCRGLWTPEHIIDLRVEQLRQQIGDEKVSTWVLSGGVDSSVVAALLHRAIGDQLTCVFVDNGLLAFERRRSSDAHVCRKHGYPRDSCRC